MPLCSSMSIKVPADVECTINKRVVTVKGKKGTLVRDFSHAPLDISHIGDTISVAVWFPRGKRNALPRTICSHIENMFKGVMHGFEYKMRLAYAHFPIAATIVDDNKAVEIRNFMHQIRTRRIDCLPGVTITMSTSVKDELILRGISIEDVSHTAARIHESLKVPHKDLRKFLDGCYVSSRGLQEQ